MINLSMKLKQKSSFLWQPNAKNRGSWVRAIEAKSPHFTKKKKKNMGSLGDSSAENRGL